MMLALMPAEGGSDLVLLAHGLLMLYSRFHYSCFTHSSLMRYLCFTWDKRDSLARRRPECHYQLPKYGSAFKNIYAWDLKDEVFMSPQRLCMHEALKICMYAWWGENALDLNDAVYVRPPRLCMHEAFKTMHGVVCIRRWDCMRP
jgi:hypothetical protein